MRKLGREINGDRGGVGPAAAQTPDNYANIYQIAITKNFDNTFYCQKLVRFFFNKFLYIFGSYSLLDKYKTRDNQVKETILSSVQNLF